eukprot:TRINITY_DN2457_c0_g1_i7.p1 TRINITY_DN2457_c0_g1~~TRINITY_DN2457_c0_g1_i7.p1  ORF type:complete len:193 (+),score=39.16 TRINITY_DN2457_c0_g1_i7:94-672(+)
MIRRPPRSTLSSSSAASDVYKRQVWYTFYIVSTVHAPYNLGLIASFINVLMYGSPAAELPTICRTRNTESMPIGTALATFLCSIFWWLYGLELADPFLIWPNVIGAVFGVVQLGTIARFYNEQVERPVAELEEVESKPPHEVEGLLVGTEGEETVDGEHTNTEGRDLLLGEASEGVNYDGINMRAKGGSPLS